MGGGGRAKAKVEAKVKEDKRQKTKDKRQKTEDRRQKAGLLGSIF